MKRFIIYSILLLFLVPTACDDPLQEEPFSGVSVDNFYSSETEFDLALNGVYARVWEAYVYKDNNHARFGDQTTDLLISRGGNPGVTDSWNWDRTTRNLADWWRDSYPAVNEANKILAELENVELDQAFEDRIEGETRFLRALFYHNLNKMFHGVPLMTEPTEGVSEDIFKPRSTYEEVWDFIENDLQIAEEKLSPFDPANHAIGRVTAASAQGLLARVHAWQREWQEAADAADRAISHAEIFLMPDYQKIWHPDYENGGEHLFTKSHGVGSSTDNIGNNNVWWKNVAGFTLADGTTVDFSRNEDDKGHSWWVDRNFYDATPETYRKMYTMRDWMPFYIPKGGDVVMETLEFPENVGPQLVKYFHLDGNYFQRTSVNDNILRTAEMYLIKAEALNELNGPTSEALEAINMVRRRARAVGTPMEQPESVYPDLTAGMSQAEFRDAVIEEFAREHIGEGLFRGVLIRHDRFTTRSWSNTDEVPAANQQEYKIWFAIPDIEMERNEELVQNEGYFEGE